MIRVGIVGAAGYTGGELLRLLIHHPHIQLKFIHSRSNAGKPISSIHHDLFHSDLLFDADISHDIDVLFLCLGHGESKSFLTSHILPSSIKIIDLANDHRLQNESDGFVYGLPEANFTAIKAAHKVANPGCFATAIQLGLLPLASQGLLSKVFTTGITGSTGAGQSLTETSHFSWRHDNIQAYKTLTHQHLGEINESICRIQNKKPKINFVPWRGDFTRGIFISSMVEISLGLSELKNIYQNYYADAVFTKLSDSAIHLKQVINTNYCLLHLEYSDGTLAIHSIIDNLVKGAVGQAIQNMNILFDLPQDTGLKIKASFF